MQTTQSPVSKNSSVDNKVLGVPSPEPSATAGQISKKKPSKWWIWMIVVGIVVIGGIFAYFQFLE